MRPSLYSLWKLWAIRDITIKIFHIFFCKFWCIYLKIPFFWLTRYYVLADDILYIWSKEYIDTSTICDNPILLSLIIYYQKLIFFWICVVLKNFVNSACKIWRKICLNTIFHFNAYINQFLCFFHKNRVINFGDKGYWIWLVIVLR